VCAVRAEQHTAQPAAIEGADYIYVYDNECKGVRHTMRVSTSGRKRSAPADRILLRRKEQSK
jgi:hypothetical protein